jgi:hypothetical protein
MLQTYAYWLMGAIANSPAVLARYAGYYKGIQSLGAAISWILDASGMMFRWQVRPVLKLATQRVRYSMQYCKLSSNAVVWIGLAEPTRAVLGAVCKISSKQLFLEIPRI